MIELIVIAALFLLLLGVLFAAFGRDERDNMRGGCKAAAIRALSGAD